MPIRRKRILSAFKKLLAAAIIVCGAYLSVITGLVVWAFEVKLNRWPIFVYGAPFVLSVGDDIGDVRFIERLKRLGYARSPETVPGPGEWNLTPTRMRIFLRHSPLPGEGIAAGPVEIGLDWTTVRSIRLLRSEQEVSRLTLEPELVDVLPAEGYPPEMCRRARPNEMNPLLAAAVVSTEDARFYSHHGVDPISMRRALKANLRAGRYVEGASTIPQQLIRMTLLSPDKTLWRKFNEIALAVVADALYGKKTILGHYLNRVYFGYWGSYPVRGAAEAARLFFGSNQADLTPAQCALLAAIIKAPNAINPMRRPDRARGRTNMILGRLLKAGRISREQYDEARVEPLNMRRPHAASVKASAFMNLARPRILRGIERASERAPAQDVLTSLDPLAQSDAIERLGRLGASSRDAHLILADPSNGALRAYLAPPRGEWSGAGGDPGLFLPIMMIPALVPERPDQVLFTLTSPVFLSDEPGRAITVRAAFRRAPDLLMRRIEGELDRGKIVEILRRFGVRVKEDASGRLRVAATPPLDVAGVYALLASLGDSAILEPGIRVVKGSRDESPLKRRHVSAPPAVLYLVNYLMKESEDIAVKDGIGRASRAAPSTFTTADSEGTWSIAYTRTALLLVRSRGDALKPTSFGGFVRALIPDVSADSVNPFPPPNGILFRRICVESGLRATSLCPRVIEEAFLEGSQPTEWCPLGHR